MKKFILVILFIIAIFPGCSKKPAHNAIDKVVAKSPQELFEKYQKLADDFDSSVTDLYSDSAKIINNRKYPDGKYKIIKLDGMEYKSLIKKAMPFAELRNDLNTFSNVSFKNENQKVRIDSTRYSKLKDYSSPVSLLVEKDTDGNWTIIEEISESKAL
ncbi:MAG: hypothetical protein GY754_07660 [bacterium]|nr:hypothetical protein [bacterium]